MIKCEYIVEIALEMGRRIYEKCMDLTNFQRLFHIIII